MQQHLLIKLPRARGIHVTPQCLCLDRREKKLRNQYLVNHLLKHGVSRTKKQVASHLQVLRNMWKGCEYYYLVAGAEDMFTDVSPEDNFFDRSHPRFEDIKAELSHAIPLDFDDSDSSSCASPVFSERRSDFSSSPGSVASMLSNSSPYTCDPAPLPMSSPRPHARNHDAENFASGTLHSSRNTAVAPSSYENVPQHLLGGGQAQGHHHLPLSNVNSVPRPPASPQNRVTKVEVATEFMPAFTVDVDVLVPPPSPLPVSLNIALSLAPKDDARFPPNVHGFSVKLCLAAVWRRAGHCVTKVFAGDRCTENNMQELNISSIELGCPNVVLGFSGLTSCRWFDSSVKHIIVQDVVVDGATLLRITYDLDRNPPSQLPTATLTGCAAAPLQALSTGSSLHHTPGYTTMSQTTLPAYQHTSLSAALTPQALNHH
ncbi:hypothetical protein BDZ89DRAFT_288677 [Hymenopellis radicata]|nr:hypothetical protein BDZ89DRAFT_288677 [Hymenopellis radicata]